MPYASQSIEISAAFDVLIIGGGAAGLYAALCLPSDLQIGLLTKDKISDSASDWAQGGIAAAIAPEDSPTLHIEDTLKTGAGLCEPEAVKLLVEQASDCVRSLVEMGVGFDRHGDTLALTLEAAHSRRRVLHAADTTGRAIVTTLTTEVLSRKNIHVLSPVFVLDLWLHPQTQRCQGVCLVSGSQIRWIGARAVLLATGGGGQVFAQTTNPALSTADGVAMAWRSNGILRDLEFVQFHPTALTKPGAPRFLISEAVRGEGAHLVDEQNHRFAFDYDPAGELAPRDIVSRAIFSHLQHTGAEQVWLDLRSIPPDRIRHRFPNIIQVCQQWGIDVFQEPIPVAPAAHYWMGGILTDLDNRTTIAGLYALGETASTGVHGANRLASNSLLECLVFGAQLRSLELPDPPILPPVAAAASLEIAADPTVAEIRAALPKLVWQSAGICRNGRSLQQAIEQVEQWRQQFADLPLSQTLSQLEPAQVFAIAPAAAQQIREWSETRNLLDVAYLILKSAAFRQESRGGHYREDFPQTDSEWQVHTLLQGDRCWRSDWVGG